MHCVGRGVGREVGKIIHQLQLVFEDQSPQDCTTFSSANAVAEDELFVKEESNAADAVVKQIAITRQVLKIIFQFFTTLFISSHAIQVTFL